MFYNSLLGHYSFHYSDFQVHRFGGGLLVSLTGQWQQKHPEVCLRQRQFLFRDLIELMSYPGERREDERKREVKGDRAAKRTGGWRNA